MIENIPASHALVMVLDASYLLGAEEKDFLRKLLDQDRARKLFFVVNKIDKLPLESLERVKAELTSQLNELGCDQKVYLVSAKRGIQSTESHLDQFNSMKQDLLCFMDREIRNSKHGYAVSRLERLKDNLVHHCDELLKLAEMDALNRQQAIEALEQKKMSVEAKIAQKKERVRSEHLRIQKRFTSNLTSFTHALKGQLKNRIQKASISELHRPELIQDFVKKGFTEFLSKEFSALQQELGSTLKSDLYDIESWVHGQRVSVTDAEKPQDSLGTHLVVPGLLIATWPIMGFLSWIPLAFGALVGKDLIQNVLDRLLKTMNERGVKEKIIESVDSAIDNFLHELMKEIEGTFAALLKENLASLDSVLNHAAMDYSEMNHLSSEQVTSGKFLELKATLQQL